MPADAGKPTCRRLSHEPPALCSLLGRQWYTDVPQNLRVENGRLVLQVTVGDSSLLWRVVLLVAWCLKWVWMNAAENHTKAISAAAVQCAGLMHAAASRLNPA